MKKPILITTGLFTVLLVVGIALLWPPAVTGTTTVQLSGNAGTAISGYYVRDGKRVVVSSVLPWSFDSVGVTKFEFRKVHTDEVIHFVAHYDEPGGANALHTREVGAGVLGVRGRVRHHGLSTASFTE